MAFVDLSDVNWFAVAVWVLIFGFSLLTLLAPPAKKVRELRPLKSEGKPDVKPAVAANITPAPVATSTPAPAPKLPVATEPSTEAKPIEQKDFPISEVAKHNKRDDCWIVVEGLVYDVTKYIPQHPGGADNIVEYAGKDATTSFNSGQHPGYVQELLLGYKIGRLL
eukprot:gene4240-4659_t